jgi:ubiquinone/menaquinone biosynthesis C-methylase UbiE
MINHDNKYTKMQQDLYDGEASKWSITDRDKVVGSFDEHNAWQDYDNYLFKNIDNTVDKIALDFGSGPGRNIVKFANRFKRIDGVDIAAGNLENILTWCKYNNVSFTPKTYTTNGVDLYNISDSCYDIVFSTICMQHICVHTIRYNLMSEMFRVLSTGGSVCIQMGFGPKHPQSIDYHIDYYDAIGTNGYSDVKITDVDQIKTDLEKIGFVDFEYDLRPVGPGDRHSQWIFFRAKKP